MFREYKNIIPLDKGLFSPVSHFISLLFSFGFVVQKGDPTLSVLELWGAEYQESNALLLRPADRSFLEKVCQREKCPVDFVGNITGDGKVRFIQDQVYKCTLTLLNNLYNDMICHITVKPHHYHSIYSNLMSTADFAGG